MNYTTMTTSTISLLIATSCAGLMAGLFFSFSFSVMPGLSRLDDYQYLSTMQSINRAILNPVFFTVFFGVLIALPLATYFTYASQLSTVSFWLLLAATLIYGIGVFLVTVIGNIPINEGLDAVTLAEATKETLSSHRQLFETRWVTLNLVRTGCSLVAFICSLLAFLSRYEKS